MATTDRLLGETTSLCRVCKRSVPARSYERAGTIVLRKQCPSHGDQETLISSNADWYHKVMAMPANLESPIGERKPVSQGCPFDCGPCQSHEQRVHLPVVPITSACNLDCPICYTHNKNDGAYHMGLDEMRAILEHLKRRAPDQRIINITGGEPTLHPQFVELIEMCRDAGIHRVTISTHGLTFIKNEAMVARLAELSARVILSFDSFDEQVNTVMLGGKFGGPKMRALELLEKYEVATTLLPVLARGMNDHEIARIVDMALHKDFIRSVEFHPMTFTGQSGADFNRSARYTTYDALVDLQVQTGGHLRIDDFVPAPVAHPLCYQVCYLLRLSDGWYLPLTRIMDVSVIRSLLTEGLYLEPGPAIESALQDTISRLWSGDIGQEQLDPGGVLRDRAGADGADLAEAVLMAMKAMIRSLFTAELGHTERMRRAETFTKAIYIHTHMDEESFDSDRIRQCCVGMPSSTGENIPSCAYNVLYRERDARFIASPAPALIQLGAGRPADSRGSFERAEEPVSRG